MSSCLIYLDNYHSQYNPGNTIIGRVVCSFGSDKNIRGIRLKLRGKEHTEWTDTESYYDDEEKKTKTRTVHYSGNNKFYFVENTLTGAGNLGPGRHEYPFSFMLPKNLPGTYHGKYGWVKYSIKATVDRPYKVDYEDEKDLNIVAPVDFNEIKNELQLEPVAYSDDKTLCCCCCASGPITMNVHLEKEAFIQGETARVKVEITNLSNENIDEVVAKMTTTVKSKVTSPRSDSKTDTELLASARDTGVGAHGENTYEFELEIPRSTVVPNFKLCTLFEQWCRIKVTAALSGCHSDMDLYAAVTLGHIPIGEFQDQFQHMSLQQTGNLISPPMQNNQYPGGMPYPPTSTQYPPNPSIPPYPNENKPPPYSSAVSPSHIFPGMIPPGGDGIGFQAPQSSKPPAEFPPLPTGVFPPAPFSNPLPYPPGPSSPASFPPPTGANSATYTPLAGPSAPPMDHASSAPSKAQLAEDDGFQVVGTNVPLLGGRGGEMLPPSYNEAVPYPPK